MAEQGPPSYPTVATIIGCPGDLTSASGLVATPLGLGGELQPPTLAAPTLSSPDRLSQSIPEHADTSSIKDPVHRAIFDNVLGKLPTKSSPEKLRCDLCDIECQGEMVFETHLKGNRHAKRLRENELKHQLVSSPYIEVCKMPNSYHCRLCNATMNAFRQIMCHMSGAKHKRQKAMREVHEKFNNAINPVFQNVDATPNLLFCATCNVQVNSYVQFVQHTESRRHKNRVNGYSIGQSSIRR